MAGRGATRKSKRCSNPFAAAGAAGLPVVEYNFYAHRLVEGYYEAPGRAARA